MIECKCGINEQDCTYHRPDPVKVTTVRSVEDVVNRLGQAEASFFFKIKNPVTLFQVERTTMMKYPTVFQNAGTAVFSFGGFGGFTPSAVWYYKGISAMPIDGVPVGTVQLLDENNVVRELCFL